MRPMSLFESLDSNGKISLGFLFRKEKMNPGVSEKNLLDYAFMPVEEAGRNPLANLKKQPWKS